jgi:hypothetical protein
VQRTPSQLNDRSAFFLYPRKSDDRVLIEAEEGLVDQRNIRPAFIADLDAISRAVRVVQASRLRLGLPGPAHLDVPPAGNHFRDRRSQESSPPVKSPVALVEQRGDRQGKHDTDKVIGSFLRGTLGLETFSVWAY